MGQATTWWVIAWLLLAVGQKLLGCDGARDSRPVILKESPKRLFDSRSRGTGLRGFGPRLHRPRQLNWQDAPRWVARSRKFPGRKEGNGKE